MNKSWKEEIEGELNYISLGDFSEVAPHIPNGAILNLVREDESDKDVLISHQGFVIRKGKSLFFRHAKRSGQIVTVDLVSYLNRQKDREWEVEGFNLNMIR